MKKLLLILFCIISLQSKAQVEQEQTESGHLYLGLGFQKVGTFYMLDPKRPVLKYTVLQVNLNYTMKNWNLGTNIGIHSFGLYVSRKLF